MSEKQITATQKHPLVLGRTAAEARTKEKFTPIEGAQPPNGGWSKWCGQAGAIGDEFLFVVPGGAYLYRVVIPPHLIEVERA